METLQKLENLAKSILSYKERQREIRIEKSELIKAGEMKNVNLLQEELRHMQRSIKEAKMTIINLLINHVKQK